MAQRSFCSRTLCAHKARLLRRRPATAVAFAACAMALVLLCYWTTQSRSGLSFGLPSPDRLGKVAVVTVIVLENDGSMPKVAVEQKTADYPVQTWASQLNLLGGNFERGDRSPAMTLQRELREEGFEDLAAKIMQTGPIRAWRIESDSRVHPSGRPYAFDAVHFALTVSAADAEQWLAVGAEGKLRVLPINLLQSGINEGISGQPEGKDSKPSSSPAASCFLWGYGELMRHAFELAFDGTPEGQQHGNFRNCWGARAVPLDNLDVVMRRWSDEG